MWREILTHNESEACVGIFGIPIDENASIEKGARLAPEVMREKSEFLPPYTADGENVGVRVFDYGDVSEFDYGKVLEMMKRTDQRGFTVMLGGDHSVSILSQKALREIANGKIGIIHIDAHADICDVYDSSKYSHACVNRRALENGYSQNDITMIGIRSFEGQEVEFLNDSSVEVFTSNDVRRLGVLDLTKAIIEKYASYDAVYLSFDIDAVDPAYAPGTGTVEAFGLSSLTVLEIIGELVDKLPVRVMDVVEVSPPLDCNNVTVWLALKYLLEVFKIIDNKQRRAK